MANSRLRIAGETYPLRVATGSTEYYFAANVLYANSTNGMYLVNQSQYLRFGASNAEIMRLIGTGNGSVCIGTDTAGGVSKLEVQRPARTTAFNAGDGDTWHDVIVRNPTNSSNAASGITFVMNNTYHKNAGAGIAAISGGSDYMASLAFITRPNGAVAAERMRIQYDGNVGIGATSPQTDLQIGDYTDASETITIATSQNGTGRINFYDNNNTEGGSIRVTGETSGSKMHFANRWTNDSTEITFDLVNGRVGIGNDAPNYMLDVSGDIRIGKGQSTGILHSGGDLQFYADGAKVIEMFTSGSNYTFKSFHDIAYFGESNVKVGIGTTAPGTKLEIIQNGAFASGQSVALQIASALQSVWGQQ